MLSQALGGRLCTAKRRDERTACGTNYPATQNNQDDPSDACAVLVNLSPGVTTIEIGASLWFKRIGASVEKEPDDLSYYGNSEKMARKTYTLQLVWKSPTTALEAPDEPPAPPRTVDYDTDDDGLIEISAWPTGRHALGCERRRIQRPWRPAPRGIPQRAAGHGLSPGPAA